jgi:hypothetical protein
MAKRGYSDLIGSVMGEFDRRDNDALSLFRPMETQTPAIKTKASRIAVRGGNRSGKSILGAAMTASVARGRQLIGPNGKPLPALRPTDRPQLIWIIGKGESHIGSTLFRLLFKPGQFPILKDPVTGRLRAAKNNAERVMGMEQGIIAPPFIPADDIEEDGLIFKRKGADYFDICKLKNGSRIETYVSNGDVKMGDPVDWIWIDEDIAYPAYVNEWLARLPDKKGRFLWTAWPWSDNWALTKMSKEAQKQREEKRPSPDVVEVKLSFRDNPFIDDDEKRKAYEAWGSSGDAELRSRVDGEFAIGQKMMYPNFTLTVHGVPRVGQDEDHLTQVLRENQWEPPKTWTRYLFYDPSHSYSAILFATVPPPEEFGDVVVLYDELYLQCMDAHQVAERVRPKLAGTVFEDFVIDWHYARQTIGPTGQTNLEVYRKVWEQFGFRSVRSGSGFTFSSDNVDAGIENVRVWMTVRGDGTTKLRVIGHKLPNFIMEVEAYQKHFEKEEARDKPATGQRDHLMDDLRYAAMHGCPYVPPPDATNFLPPDPVYLAFQRQKGVSGIAGHTEPLSSSESGFASIHCGIGPTRQSA